MTSPQVGLSWSGAILSLALERMLGRGLCPHIPEEDPGVGSRS